jgi:Fungal specific transcription factor domain
MFLQGSSAPQACWTMVGIGLRLAQEVGAHRRKVYSHKLTVEEELWKRAFWYAVT